MARASRNNEKKGAEKQSTKILKSLSLRGWIFVTASMIIFRVLLGTYDFGLSGMKGWYEHKYPGVEIFLYVSDRDDSWKIINEKGKTIENGKYNTDLDEYDRKVYLFTSAEGIEFECRFTTEGKQRRCRAQFFTVDDKNQKLLQELEDYKLKNDIDTPLTRDFIRIKYDPSMDKKTKIISRLNDFTQLLLHVSPSFIPILILILLDYISRKNQDES